MVKSDDPEYRTPRLIMGWAFAVLGGAQIVARFPAWSGTSHDIALAVLGVLQLVFGIVVVIQAWRLPKNRPAESDPSAADSPER